MFSVVVVDVTIPVASSSVTTGAPGVPGVVSVSHPLDGAKAPPTPPAPPAPPLGAEGGGAATQLISKVAEIVGGNPNTGGISKLAAAAGTDIPPNEMIAVDDNNVFKLFFMAKASLLILNVSKRLKSLR